MMSQPQKEDISISTYGLTLKAATSICVRKKSIMKQYLLMKLGDFVISVSEGDKSSEDKEWLLIFYYQENDSRTFDKEGYRGKHYLVESERGSGLTVSLMRVACLG